MAEINKLSVETALNKLREADAPKPASAQQDDRIAELQEEAKRLRAQRLRLARRPAPDRNA